MLCIGKKKTSLHLAMICKAAFNELTQWISVFYTFTIIISISIFIFQEEISKLLRFESSKLETGTRTSLVDYSARQKSDQKYIYYLAAPR